MAYQGYLIKVGNYTIPLKYIKADSYSVTLNSQDIDSYRDADGLLHRNALEHKVAKAEFNTIPMLTDAQVDEILGNIESQFTNAIEKKASVTFYVPEKRAYMTQDAYMADVEMQPYWADAKMIQYNPFRIAFIGY